MNVKTYLMTFHILHIGMMKAKRDSTVKKLKMATKNKLSFYFIQ